MNLVCFLLPVILFGGVFFLLRNKKNDGTLDPRWGDYYNKIVNLNSDERDILNIISYQVRFNLFYKKDFCRDNTIDLFLTAYRLLPTTPSESQSLDLFYYCTSELKKIYRVGLPHRKGEEVGVEKQYPNIPYSVKEKVEKACSDLPKLTLEQEKILYRADNRRWRFVLEDLKTNYSDSIQFYNDIKLNESLIDASIATKRNLYYDSYLFTVDKDKVISLKFYIHYLSIKSESATFKYRDISKKNQKILFANENQSEHFSIILDEYNKKNDLNQALSEIEEVFTKKRKVVILDEEGIKSAKDDLVGVVDLLNEYLEDEEKTEKPVTLIMENVVPAASIKVELTNIQTEFIERLASESCTLSLVEVDTFANTKGIFKSQLIDGINNVCYDILDDMLIEEDENGYTLNEKYYKQLWSQI